MVCYRHPDRETGVLCQRCERPICPQCQNPSAVGFLCPEDARVPRSAKVRSGYAITYGLIGLNILVYLLQLLDVTLIDQIAYTPLVTLEEPWRLVTNAFAHSQTNYLHIVMNMFSLYVFGKALEPLLGPGRFFTLYFYSIIGGSLGVLFLSSPNTWVVGASGAIFGLMGAYFVIMRSLGNRDPQLLGIIAINLFLGFIVQGVAWQAHVGGLIVGVLVALIYSRTRASNQRNNQVALLSLLAVVLIGAVYVGVQLIRF